MNAREEISNDFGSASLTGRRSGFTTGRVLKGLLVIGVVWVALNVVFGVVGALTSSEGIEASETSTIPGSVRMLTDDDRAPAFHLVITSPSA